MKVCLVLYESFVRKTGPKYSTAQMQLHSRARVTSGALEGLLKVTRHKLCESSRFSTLSSLVSITHPGIRLSASYDFYRALQ